MQNTKNNIIVELKKKMKDCLDEEGKKEFNIED